MELPPLIANDPASLEALGRVEVLYTDLDGTLLARGGCLLADSEGDSSTVVAEAIVALNRAGLTVVPISGRGRIQLTEVTRLLGWTDFIAEAGAVIVRGVGTREGATVTYNHGEWSDSLLAGGATPFQLIEESGAFERLLAEFPGLVEYHTPWHDNREATHLLRGCLDLARAQEVLEPLALPVGILDNGVVRNAGALACGDQLPHAYHLVPRGVSKAQAIELDLAARGLTREQAAAIGDSVTDVEMADAVAVMALVQNAFDSAGVRAELDRMPRDNVYCTCCQRGDGWAEFARAWLEAREK
jgi:predicted mannosyl-3-phosphoglycerate phosphatase (HAD superfamily)